MVARFRARRTDGRAGAAQGHGGGCGGGIGYQSREAEGTQTPLQTIDCGWGSCRDFAVLFAKAARCLGFGARIISGYLYNPDRAPAVEGPATGAGSTHAWAEIFLPGAGWITFDPTNRAVGGDNLIPLAVGRVIAQVMPLHDGCLSGACRSMSRSRREVATIQQRIDVALSGDFLDAVLGDDLSDQFVVGLEVGQFLLGELAPLAPMAFNTSLRSLSCARAALFVAEALDMVSPVVVGWRPSNEDRAAPPADGDEAVEYKGGGGPSIFGACSE